MRDEQRDKELEQNKTKKEVSPSARKIAEEQNINLEKKYSDMLKNGMVIKLKFINDEKNNENKLVLVKNDSKLVCIANLEKEYIIPRRNFNL